jgi:hypothetical protein
MPEKVPSSTTSGSFASCLAFTADGRRLATGHPDSTILLWDLALPRPASTPLTAEELDALWRDLGGTNATKAWHAVWRLVDLPNDTVGLLRDRLKSVEPAPVELTRRLIADLDDSSFTQREKALRQLQELGPRAEPALREALRTNLSTEQKRRIDELLAALASPQRPGPEALRALRAVSGLERNASPAARSLLAALAEGVPEARPTRAAKAALGRLVHSGK